VVQPENQGNDSASGVLVTVDVSPIEGGQTVQRPVTFQGLRETRTAVARPSQVDVILSGPLPRLQSLTIQDVKVIVDLFGLEPGVHKVKPTVVVPEGLRVENVLPDTVEVEISIGRPLTPTPTATPGRPAATPGRPAATPGRPAATATLTPTSTLTITATITPTATLIRTRTP
jgi:hypothetical protein